MGNICNCHFGGPENKTLFCTGDGGLFSIPLKIPGRVWPAATTTGIGPLTRLALKGRKPSGAFRIDGRFWPEGSAKKGTGGGRPALLTWDAAR
jgi:hypothetical protein